MDNAFGGVALGTFIAWILIGVVLLGMWGCPNYKVYQQRLEGEAEYARAEYNRKIRVLEASAAKDSATMLAEADILKSKGLATAEVERAKGAAEANTIIAAGLGGPEGYLRYLWISGLQHEPSQIIYIPTEAGMPILEAGHRK